MDGCRSVAESFVIGEFIYFDYYGDKVKERLYKVKRGIVKINPKFGELWKLLLDNNNYTFTPAVREDQMGNTHLIRE